MARAARDFRVWWGRHLLPARSDFGPGTARRPPDCQEMQRHRARPLCDHRRPCWQRSGRSCMASPEPLPLGPAAAANAPLPGASGRALCAAITAALTYTTSELFVRWAQPLLPPEAAQKLSRVSSGPPASKRMCGPGASAIAPIWRPGKGTRRCISSADTPGAIGAICGHPGQDLRSQAHWTPLLVARSLQDLLSQLNYEPLKSRLDPN